MEYPKIAGTTKIADPLDLPGLATYDAAHRGRTNFWCHVAGIPLLVMGLAGWLHPLHVGPLDLAAVGVVLLSLYYIGIAGTGAAVTLFGLLVIYSLAPLAGGLWPALFFIAGVGLQAFGHFSEGNRPAFGTDFSTALLGPLWLGALTLSRRS